MVPAPDQQLIGDSARFPTLCPHQPAVSPAAFSQSLCPSVSDEDASDSSTMSQEQHVPRRLAPLFRLLREQTKSPGSASSLNQHPPIVWLPLVQLVTRVQSERETCDCLWFHLGENCPCLAQSSVACHPVQGRGLSRLTG